MAIDPRIALMGQGVDVRSNVAAGLQVGEQIRTMGVRDAILEQRQQLGAQQLQMNAQSQALQSFKQLGNVIDGLASIPDLAQRAKVLAQNTPMLQEMGIPPARLASMDLSDQGLASLQQSFRPFIGKIEQQLPAGAQEFQFYQNILNDPNASEDQKKAARIELGLEARAGRLQTQEVSPGVFQTFDPNAGAVDDPYRVVDGQRIPLTRQEQQDLRLSEDVQREITVGEAQTEVELGRQQELSDIRLAEAREQSRRDRAGALLDEMAQRNQNAARQQIRLTEAFQLASQADQGLTGYAKIQLSRLPGLSGIDVSDTAALDSALKSIALEQLQAFKGPTTDFEFGVVQDISGDILGSEAANKARIAALQRSAWFQQKEAEQARQFILNGGDARDFAFNFEEVINTSRGEFTLRDIQDTAVYYNISIEEALKRLNGGE